jgi:hypothetical protein
MPAPRLLPDNDVLAALRRQGWTYDDIARQYGVSRGAVYLRLKQAHATTTRARHAALIPWTVALRHAQAVPVRMLRLLGQRENGDTLSPAKARMLDKWLIEVGEADVVICYEPEYPPNPASPENGGFYYSRRRAGERGLVRPPVGA